MTQVHLLDMVIQGVSTRKVSEITDTLCGTEFSKSTVSNLYKELDPVVESFRSRPLSRHDPFLIVDAIYMKARDDGRIKSQGFLIATGINDDDNHGGMKKAIQKQFHGAGWQRCQTHFSRNLLDKTPK